MSAKPLNGISTMAAALNLNDNRVMPVAPPHPHPLRWWVKACLLFCRRQLQCLCSPTAPTLSSPPSPWSHFLPADKTSSDQSGPSVSPPDFDSSAPHAAGSKSLFSRHSRTKARGDETERGGQRRPPPSSSSSSWCLHTGFRVSHDGSGLAVYVDSHPSIQTGPINRNFFSGDF